nr:unnamed protein product [Callosobruchus analis]
MGSSKSKHQDLTENGAVNSNFIVTQEKYNVTRDVKIVLYLILTLLVLQFALKLFQIHVKGVKRRMRRSLAASVASVHNV